MFFNLKNWNKALSQKVFSLCSHPQKDVHNHCPQPFTQSYQSEKVDWFGTFIYAHWIKVKIPCEIKPLLTLLKLVYPEKATNFCEISTLDLSYIYSNSQIYSGDFAKFCGLFRIYEL